MTTERKKYLTADARRTQLVELGLSLFGARPYEDVQIDEIARAAGIAKGLLYHYFGSKRGLYLEVVRAASAELVAALEPDPGLSGPDNLRRGMLAYFGFVEARADAYVTLMQGGMHSDPDLRALLDDVRATIIQRITRGIGIATLPPAFRVAARSWIGAVEAAALDWLEHRDLEASALADVLAAGLFGQLVVASGLAPVKGAKLDLAAGLRLLGGLMGGHAEGRAASAVTPAASPRRPRPDTTHRSTPRPEPRARRRT